MKNLEQVQRHSIDSDGDVYADRDGSIISYKEALSAARLDNNAARAEGYRQGVEDGNRIEPLKRAEAWLFVARRRVKVGCRDVSRSIAFGHMQEFKRATDEAFRGARGVKRAEIRQRLERMEQGK